MPAAQPNVRWLTNFFSADIVDHRISELATSVQEGSDLLRRHGVTFWADWLCDDAARIRRLDFSGIEHLLSAYGAMGSLTDVFICPQNGHAIEDKDVELVNARLGSLLSRMYNGAKQLSREEFAPTHRDPAI